MEGYWKWVINSYIIIFLFCVLTWFLNESPVKTQITQHTWNALVAFGWYQHWGLFSPEVRHRVYHETAVLRFKDGTLKMYEYPRAQKMSQWERFKHEKLRKICARYLSWQMGEPFLPAFSKHLACYHYSYHELGGQSSAGWTGFCPARQPARTCEQIHYFQIPGPRRRASP